MIELCDVHFAYGQQDEILSGCSLALFEKQKLGVTGPIGSGKTTLLWVIVGLLRPRSGTIIAFGKERVKESDFYEVRRRVGLLFQQVDDQLFCPTVIEELAFGPLNLGKSQEEAWAIANEVLTELELEGYRWRCPYHLSAGEKRLIALASVFTMKPDVLLLDEPTAELDEKTRKRVTQIIAQLPQAMIIVSHDEDLLDSVAHARLVLQDGKLWDEDYSRRGG
ncbi:MAG: energy-coupling factor ABC transporter ATP-binding protein [Thermoguttaceae bacterium]|nr:energy-coupling factor ABC transporter ATP-binding protein [Thermoguttaceae bacterium]MDW8078896.1 ABC transporter ATP-binding protein [Thermoguttaceae bacterium]